jgi:dihydrofolate reductase
MGKLSFGMLQSLDGYVAGPAGGPQSGGVLSEKAAAELPPPGPITFRHFADHVRSLDGIVYGRSMYEIMRYWEEDKPAGKRWSMISRRHGVRS